MKKLKSFFFFKPTNLVRFATVWHVTNTVCTSNLGLIKCWVPDKHGLYVILVSPRNFEECILHLSLFCFKIPFNQLLCYRKPQWTPTNSLNSKTHTAQHENKRKELPVCLLWLEWNTEWEAKGAGDCRCCFHMSTCNRWSAAATLMLEIVSLLLVSASLAPQFLRWLPDSHKICHTPFTAMLITSCAYSCAQYSLSFSKLLRLWTHYCTRVYRNIP